MRILPYIRHAMPALAGVLVMLIPHFAVAQVFEPSADGLVVMEAEHYTTNVAQGVHTWSENLTPGYVGDSAMQAFPDSGTVVKSNFDAGSPRLDFEVDFAGAGSVSVWLRGFGPSWNADSVWIGIDGDVSSALFASPPKDGYGWLRPSGTLTVPSAGVHTINVWMREDGTIVDRLLLTPDGSLRPSGDGPPESSRGGGGDPDNTWPIAANDVFTVAEDSNNNTLAVLSDTGDGADFDPDGDPINISSASSPGSAGGTITVNGTADGILYTPATDYAGAEVFNYTITDGRGGTSTATVTVTVSNDNSDPPVLAAVGDRSATEAQQLAFRVTASDVDGPLPSLTADLGLLSGTPVFTDNGNGTADFSWTPLVGDAPGPYSVTFTATDAANGSLTVAETIQISVQAAGGGGDPGGGTGAFEPSPDGLVVMEAEHFTANIAQGAHTWSETLTPGYVGDSAMQAVPDSGTVVKSNLDAGSPRLDFEVDFAVTGNVNVWLRGFGPSWNADSVWIGIDGEVSSALFVSPPKDGYGWVRPSGTLTVPSAGVHTISVWMREDGTIIDRLLLTPDGSLRPSGDGPPESSRSGGDPGNTWPIAANDVFTVAEDSNNNVLAVLSDTGNGVDFDPDGDPISISSASSPGNAGGTITVNGTADGILYTPATDYAGAEVFNYTITDGRGGVSTAMVTVTVSNDNSDPPVLAAVGNRSATEAQQLAFRVTASDVDGPPPSLTADLGLLSGTPVFTDNGNGTADFSWTPSAGDAPGPYSVIFTATDAANGSLTVTESILISVQAAGGGGGGGTGAFEPSAGGLVVMEAEHFTTNVAQGVHTWSENLTPGYVGDSAMQAVPDSGTVVKSNFDAGSPRLDFEVDFAGAGSVSVWLRGFGPSWNADSVWIGIDGEVSSALFVSPPKDGYGWVRPSGTLTVPSAGVHTISVWMREDGTIIDRLLLTPDGSLRPSGDGPPESSRGGGDPGGALELPFVDNFADGDSDGWSIADDSTQFPSSWAVIAGTLVQAEWTNSSGKDVTETYHRGSYARLDDSLDLADYRVSVEIRPGDESADDVGLMFRYTDNDHYYRVSLNSLNGFARLESNLNGTYRTLARNFRGYEPGELLTIVVEVEGALLHVFINDDPLFAAHDTDHLAGGVALYSRDHSAFDNVTVTMNDAAPAIVIWTPEAHSVLPGAPQSIDVATVVRNLSAPSGSVAVQYRSDGVLELCNVSVESPDGVYTAQCSGVQAGEYEIDALLLDNGVELARDTNSSVAVGSLSSGGHHYDALGNSITRGVGDDYAADNLTLTQQRTIGVSGWPALLGDLLTSSEEAPSLVGNEGIPGDRADDLRFARLGSIIERNPGSDRALITIGTNDSNDFSTTSPAVLVSHIQGIIDTLRAEGRNPIYVSLLPPAWGARLATPYPNPLDPSASRNQTIISYNSAIQTLVPQSGVMLGPDLFSCFLTPAVNRFSLFEDSLHPNALGHSMIAALWEDAITNGPVNPPMDPCPAPVFILEALDPYTHGHKQNLLEVGDEYYTDENFTLTSVPTELKGGVWVLQANADNSDASDDFLSFNTGANPVTIYIAYDPAGGQPTSSTHMFAPAELTGTLDVSDATVGTMSVVSAAGVTGAVVIGGNKSGGGASPQQAYVVIVVP